MRRLPLPALLALVLAFPAAAQSQYADSAGAYVSIDGFPVSWGGSGLGLILGGRAEIGRRFGNGYDAGLIGSYVANGTRSTTWSVGATGGLTRPAPLGTVARLQGVALYESGAYAYEERSIDQTGLVGDVSATLGRSIPVVGSLRIQPTAGAFARIDQPLTAQVEGFGPNPQISFKPRLSTGIQLELPLTFRLFGADATFAPGMRLDVFSSLARPGLSDGIPSGAFRLNF